MIQTCRDLLSLELSAHSVLDIGRGTGSLANLLDDHKIKFIGLEPAQSTLDFAQTKSNTKSIEWILGDVSALPSSLKVDLVIMTGNVAQVFITDQSW